MKAIIKGEKNACWIFQNLFTLLCIVTVFACLCFFNIFIRSWRKSVTHMSKENLSLDDIIVDHLRIKCRKQVTTAGTGCNQVVGFIKKNLLNDVTLSSEPFKLPSYKESLRVFWGGWQMNRSSRSLAKNSPKYWVWTKEKESAFVQTIYLILVHTLRNTASKSSLCNRVLQR